MKKLFSMTLVILVCLTLMGSLIACSGNKGVSEEEWKTLVDPSNFENYTLDIQGNMTVRVNGVTQVEDQPMHSAYRTTAEAVEVVMFDGDDEISVVLKGEQAKVQKTESSQIFLAILGSYDNFTYDAEANVYKIQNKMITTEVTPIVNGEAAATKTPVSITVKSGELTLSGDGKLAKLVCDYSQEMEINGQTTVTEGNTTWTFSNFGTTVVNAK